MPELNYNIVNGVCVITVSGTLDSLSDLDILEETRRLISDLGIERCVIDISDCGLINSMVVSHLVEMYRSTSKKDGRISVCAAPESARVLEISGLKDLLRVRNSINQSLESLS